ncbi:unnamed protein product [Nippostrongylus brasiliensis]|uniref:Inositol-pentakisphosphate 2-kinase n=1 Tax=Nippostrongylus brasiliensis TaxID=27835 RepID=A0A0N4XDU3_NIPBR|nr:unnamed protein product [Nippostrongylus brasiliensis]
MVDIVDPRQFRAFCFRGEGRANFVISAKHAASGTRIVWRFAKSRKSGLLTWKAKSELVNQYMERFVSPFFDSHFLVNPRIVEMAISDVHQLAKIPSLPTNFKVEKFEELLTFPDSMSFFPLVNPPRTVVRLSALEMLDATRIPKHLIFYIGPTITVEIKPKQGFFQNHASVDLPFCNNCILQLEKCGSDHYEEMYDFCPLDLFSGNLSRMKSAIEALFKVPHRNFLWFINFTTIIVAASISSFFQLCFVLAGCDDVRDFSLKEHSVLGQILAAQKIDTVGIVKAHQIYKGLSSSVQKELHDKSRLPLRGLEVLEEKDDRSLLEQYLLAATMKDCSVSEKSIRILTVKSRLGLCFAYSVKIVDLDPKTPKNLVNAYARFMAGVKMIRLESVTREPCLKTL